MLVGLGTVFAEHYRVPESPDLRIYVIADHVDISGDEELFEGGRTTLVLPVDAEPTPAGIPDLRAGSKGVIDLNAVVTKLAGQVAVLEGGPSLAGEMVALGLVDEFFVTLSPHVIAGNSPARRPRSRCRCGTVEPGTRLRRQRGLHVPPLRASPGSASPRTCTARPPGLRFPP